MISSDIKDFLITKARKNKNTKKITDKFLYFPNFVFSWLVFKLGPKNFQLPMPESNASKHRLLIYILHICAGFTQL